MWVGIGLLAGLIIWTASVSHLTPILPPLLLGLLLLVLRHRYWGGNPGWRKLSGTAIAVYIGGATLYFVTHLPRHPLILFFMAVAVLIVILNTQFYLFLAARRGRLFALAAVPFHLLYHFYNGISFLAGTAYYVWRRFVARGARTEPGGEPLLSPRRAPPPRRTAGKGRVQE